jgi:sulfatase maturation enzyme AslB (radical SAM superfamily)
MGYNATDFTIKSQNAGFGPAGTKSRDHILVARDLRGRPFAFSPLLCQIYALDETETPAELCEDRTGVADASCVEAIAADIEAAIETFGFDALHRVHTPGIAVIVTQDCNLSCNYCLAKQGTYGVAVTRANFERTKEQIRGLFETRPDIEFIKFFGGEPTLEIDLIGKICAFVSDELGKSVHYAVTTNGTLPARNHIDLWKKYHFSVAVSIDGPRAVHDAVRTNRGGRGSFDKALDYCATLDAAGFPFAVVGVYDKRHFDAGLSYLDTIRFLNTISPLSKITFVEALGDAAAGTAVEGIDLSAAETQIVDAIDAIWTEIVSNWVAPATSHWTYDNNLWRFISAIVTGSGRPYKHACTASALTTLFPSGTSMPCYTMAERPELAFGGVNTPSATIEDKRSAYRATFEWVSLEGQGVHVPWYRGIVGDICVADMLNSASGRLEQSAFYRCFQETAVRRLLQHIAGLDTFALEQARLLHAVNEHKKITGEFTAKMGYVGAA